MVNKLQKKVLSLITAIMLVLSVATAAYANNAAVKPGDIDGDGEVAMTDVVLLQRSIAKLVTLTDEQFAAADVDGNKELNMLDVVAIQKYIAKLITEFKTDSSTDTDVITTDTEHKTTDTEAVTDIEKTETDTSALTDTDDKTDTGTDTASDSDTSSDSTETDAQSNTESDTASEDESDSEAAIIDFAGTALKLSELKEYETSATYAWKSKGGEGSSTCTGITLEDILNNFVTLPENAESLTFTANDDFSKTFMLDANANGVYYVNDDGVKMMLAWSVDDEETSLLRLIVPFDGENANKGSWVGSVVTVTVNHKEEQAIIDFAGTDLKLSELKEYAATATYAWKSKGGEGSSTCTGITLEDILNNFVTLPENAESLTFTANDGFSKNFMLDANANGVYYVNDDGVKMMLAWSVDGEDTSLLRLIVPFDGENANKGSWVGSVVSVTVNLKAE